MRSKALFILVLLAIIIAAPVVDATVCKDCNNGAPFPDMSKRLADTADQSAPQLYSDTSGSPSPNADAAQDLCPVCYNIAAAMSIPVFGAPYMISYTYHLSKLIALPSPSYSINKPPQN